jgi:hypothetical protein
MADEKMPRVDAENPPLSGEKNGEETKNDEPCGRTDIGGAGWTFERRFFLDDAISFCVPNEFTPMPQELARLKYPSEHRPAVILGDSSGVLGFCINHTVNPADEKLLEPLLESGADTMKRMVPGARVLSKTLSLAGEKPIAVSEYTAAAVDTVTYNAMLYAELSGRLLIVSFNCANRSRRVWQPYALKMLESLRLHEMPRKEVF